MVNKATITSDIWNEFRNIIKDNIVDPQSRSAWIYGDYPDFLINSASIKASDYPLIIINDPDAPWSKLTLKRNVAKFTISIEVFSITSLQCATLCDSIINAIETGKVSLADSGLQKIYFDGVSSDMFLRGTIKVHYKKLNFRGDFAFLKTTGY